MTVNTVATINSLGGVPALVKRDYVTESLVQRSDMTGWQSLQRFPDSDLTATTMTVEEFKALL